MLTEKYRPKSFEEVIGQERAIKSLKRLDTLSGRAYWIAGPSGTGKTTIARIIAVEIADKINVIELDATALTLSELGGIEDNCRYYGFGARQGKAIIVNEAHGLRKDTVKRLLVTLERIPAHVAWIFTTTDDGNSLFQDGIDGFPLISRCFPVPMARTGLAEVFARRAREIAQVENLNGKPESVYLKLVKESRNNFRSVLQAIEAGQLAE